MKTLYLTFGLLIASVTLVLAGNPTANTNTGSNTNEHTFKRDGDVALDVERINGKVNIHIKAVDVKQYETIIIERGAGETAHFSRVKYIVPSKDGINSDYFVKEDSYPMSAKADSYYKITTISKDGVERSYPPIQLPSVEK